MNSRSLPRRACGHCNGTGRVLDSVKIGVELRAVREARVPHVSVRQLARRLKISSAYLNDLEAGRRGWTTERVTAYLAALRAGAGSDS